ncbi:UNVERIFIED_ORG: hypothetical protein GGE53_002022 [Rhizobium etli]
MIGTKGGERHNPPGKPSDLGLAAGHALDRLRNLHAVGIPETLHLVDGKRRQPVGSLDELAIVSAMSGR